MDMFRKPVFQTIVLFAFGVSGCASFSGGEAGRNYREMNAIQYERTAGIEGNTDDIALTDTSEVSDYLAYAAMHNPKLRAAFNRWKAALENIPQVSSLPDPRFTYAYFIENVETRVGPQRHRVDLTQTFPWFGKLALMGDVALEEANIQRQKYEKQKLTLFYKVEAEYNDYYFLSRSITVTEENLKLLSYFERVARTQYESGKAAYADVIKAQVELGKLEERLLSLKDMMQTAEARLNALLNRPSDALLPPPTSLQNREIVFSDEDIISMIPDNNPDLKALDASIEKASKSRSLAEKQFYPDMTVGFGYVETGPSSMPDVKDSGKDPVMTMFSINLPIWRNKYHAAVREAELRQKSAAMIRENKGNVLVSNLKTALYNYRDAGRKKELFGDNLIPKARQALHVTQSAFESGKKDFLSLIDTQRTLLEFELSYERARANRETFRAEVEMLVGKKMEI